MKSILILHHQPDVPMGVYRNDLAAAESIALRVATRLLFAFEPSKNLLPRVNTRSRPELAILRDLWGLAIQLAKRKRAMIEWD
jgi:hypothetical protein